MVTAEGRRLLGEMGLVSDSPRSADRGGGQRLQSGKDGLTVDQPTTQTLVQL